MPHRPLALALILIAGPTAAQDRGYPLAPLIATGTSIVGETIRYPVTGPAKLTAAIVILAPGASVLPQPNRQVWLGKQATTLLTVVHKHGVSLFAYILDGELSVDYGDKGTRTYKKGDAFMEAMELAHFGVNNGAQPVRILALYIGAEGANNVIPVK